MRVSDIEAMPRGPSVAQQDVVERLTLAIQRLAILSELLEEIDAELDGQLYDEEHVRSMRNSDQDIAPDCEHHVIINHDLWMKIKAAAQLARG